MKIDLNVDVRHLTRVEGHGDIRVRVESGQLLEARWDVVETPRFFEVMLKGKHYSSAPLLTARICGICSIGHALASLRATERAFGVQVPPAAEKLRLLAKHGETLQSHWLHLFFLAAPDLLGLPSALPLLESHPQLFALVGRLKGLANRLCDLVAGRTTHPVSLKVGGVTRRPPQTALMEIRAELERSLEDVAAAVEFFRTLELPSFERETEFVSLLGDGRYPFIGGRLVSSDGVLREEDEYEGMTNEYVDADNTSKLCRLSRDSFAVGALARFHNNGRWLHPAALAAADALGLSAPCHNPFQNNTAQLVECVHVTHEALGLLDELLAEPRGELAAPVRARAGEGVGAVEVPRGILYHHYVFGEDGRVERANCVIPTTQNNANIQRDLRQLVEQHAVAGMTDEGLESLCSVLVRSYDPCISCSVH